MRSRSCLIAFLLASLLLACGCGTSQPTVDATNQQSLDDSLRRMTAGMSEQQKEEFMAATLAVATYEQSRPARDKGIIEGYHAAASSSRTDAYKSMHGMTAAEVIARAAEIRARSGSSASPAE